MNEESRFILSILGIVSRGRGFHDLITPFVELSVFLIRGAGVLDLVCTNSKLFEKPSSLLQLLLLLLVRSNQGWDVFGILDLLSHHLGVFESLDEFSSWIDGLLVLWQRQMLFNWLIDFS